MKNMHNAQRHKHRIVKQIQYCSILFAKIDLIIFLNYLPYIGLNLKKNHHCCREMLKKILSGYVLGIDLD